jgi:hypothetical protein
MGISPLTSSRQKMIKLGAGYNLWARVIDETLSSDKLDKLLMVADKAKKDPLLICKRFLPSWDPLTSMQLALNNGPCGTIMSIQSNDYLQAVQIIKKFFLPNPPAPSFTTIGYAGHVHVPATRQSG